MTVNYYFNNFENSMEQQLIDDLIVESIRVYGHDVWYLPRTLGAKDELLNEDDLPIFNNAYFVEMYIKNVEGFEGEGDFLSKFGLQIRDSITFTISLRRFGEDIGAYTQDVRPKEGDVIYFPLNGKMFEVMHVEHEAVFYQMGALQTYDIRCELFEYSGERFRTGINEIDTKWAHLDLTSNTSNANVESVDVFADNATIESIADDIIDFTQENPFGEDNW